MFFFFSKLLAFLLTPLIWAIALLSAGLFSKRVRQRRIYLMAGVVVLYFFSNAFICNEVYNKWEYPFSRLDSTAKFEYVVLLGGYSDYDTAYARVKFTDAGDRFMQSYQLYQQGKVKKFFISGGSGSVLYQNETEGDKIKNFLLSLKVPESDIIMEKESRNTHENAAKTADWLAKNDPNAKCLLVTSASHMRRALGCYNKAGVNVRPYATHRLSDPRRFDPETLFIPRAGNLTKWDMLIKEAVGIVAYKIAGYI